MKIRNKSVAVTLVATVICALALSSRPVQATTIILDDTFSNGSTLNNNITPTVNSTSHDILSSKLTTSTIGPNDLSVQLASSSSGAVENQALFNAVTLSSTGDYVDFTMTFVPRGIMTDALAVDTFCIGLFGSGGNVPLTTLAQSGLNGNAGSTVGAVAWQGFYSQMSLGTINNSKLYSRPQQTATANAAQDVLFSGGFTGAFNTPKGNNFNGSALGYTMANAGTYTADFRVTLSGSGSITVTEKLYGGVGTSGSTLFSATGTTNDATFTSYTLDGLAFGWYRKTGTPNASSVDVSEMTVSIPEPSTWVLAASGLALMLGLIRRRNS